MAITIRDVAKRCGLSVSAVSKALNNYPDVSDETRQRVIRAVQEIGYHPSAIARGLKTNHTYNLGVILSAEIPGDSLMHPHFITILTGFKREAEEHGYDITLINHDIGGQASTYLNHCRYRNVDGVCLMCVDFYHLEVSELVQGDVPLVTIDHFFSGRDCVMNDNKAGMRDLMRYLMTRGHRRIAFIHGNPSAVTDARLAAFYEVIHEAGIDLPVGYVDAARYLDTKTTKEAVRRLLALPERPTCIIMPDDCAALGGIEQIREMGLRVPEDISVAGYDGVSMIQLLHPRLTTVRQQGQEIGRLAAIRLLERLESPKKPVARPDVVVGELLPGETVWDLTV